MNRKSQEKTDLGNAEATYWQGVYQHVQGEGENHNSVARELIEKSAGLGCERAKKLARRERKGQ